MSLQKLAHHSTATTWRRTGLAACLTLGLNSFALAQGVSEVTPATEPEDKILVPEGLERLTETPPADTADDTDAPRTTLGEDVENRVVGKVVSVDGTTLTLLDGDKKRKFDVTKGAKVTKDGETVQLDQLKPHDVVRLMTDGRPDKATQIVAVSPAPSSSREPSDSLRQRRRAEGERDDREADARRMAMQQQQSASQQSAGNGRTWIIAVDAATATESGIRPGDTILVVDQNTIRSEGALNLSSGAYPLRTNASGEVIVGANSAGVSLLGPGGIAVPTGVGIGTGATNGVNPNGANQPGANQPRSTVGDQNFGPPIGARQNPADRNFGPPIGTGNAPAQNPQAPAGADVPQPPQPQQGTGGAGQNAGGTGSSN